MSNQIDYRFSLLVKAWNDHEELRESGASIDSLWESRVRLDEIRVESYRALAHA